MSDLAHMRAALGLARRGLGSVWPNPTVGCVLVKDGAVVGRGWTQPGGRPHGETEALQRAGAAARGATAYVSLEPCNHWGKTPPCTEALIAAGVSRVVVPVEDPDPRVSGRGVARLRDAGIEVTMGIEAEAATALNEGFFRRIQEGRPLVTLKLATTLDGRIATAEGESRWITGERARDRAHLLRARHDAVMVGSNTVLADDPELTCRLPGLAERSPVRIIVDGRLRVPLTAKVVAEAQRVPTWFITLKGDAPARHRAFRDCGVELIEVRADGETVDLGQAMHELGKRGLTRVLVEGGATLAAALLRADLVDRVDWFRAPSLIGGDGVPAVTAFGIATLAAAPRFERIAAEALGADLLESFRRPR
ncbi:MAG TPA: bifunctional diaminohydroxyphosphoribosylaminopyrimidine deaminase/5-amino-6-(5-phosphoribosylamino)uracil reductase RibD [Stellaceae bacterium]|nr:bifunctional diaminohydroxyphosphoribosylaminopyrimidine deaminase/5-amino-6-(5-phosphoribosylamino)uracil reductase RibD [Stellaceae bacterium]